MGLVGNGIVYTGGQVCPSLCPDPPDCEMYWTTPSLPVVPVHLFSPEGWELH